jgi:hypothetical protein
MALGIKVGPVSRTYADGDEVVVIGLASYSADASIAALGSDWVEFEWIEGHKKGQTGVMLTDDAKGRRVAAKQASYRAQQVQFATLHQEAR